MTTVIVPLDGSVEAESALPHARTLAGPSGQLLLVTSVWHGEPPAPRQYFETRARRLAGEPVDTKVVVDVRPSIAILGLLDEVPDALLCMAAHGRNALAAAVLGSTAEAVLQGVTRPVMLVGPHAVYDVSRASAGNLTIAIDSVETADAVVPVAARFAARHHLHPWVVESWQPAPYPFVADAAVATTVFDAKGATRAVELLGQRGCISDSKVVTAADPADGVIEFARDLPATYLVVGSHGRRGLARWALGSVAVRVVHRSPCPVLVVRS